MSKSKAKRVMDQVGSKAINELNIFTQEKLG